MKRVEVLEMSKMKYVLQRRNSVTGQWQTKGLIIVGKPTALKVLNNAKKKASEEFRVVPKTVADAYRQGWADHEDYVQTGAPARKAIG